MAQRPPPQWQPIDKLPVIASAIDGLLESAEEQYPTLEEARPRPSMLDDATVGRVADVDTLVAPRGRVAMGMLIDQLRRATIEWSARAGRQVEEIAWFAMLATGGYARYERVGRMDPMSVPPEQRADLTGAQTVGHYTIEQMCDWLERLTTEMSMAEDFLVVAVVKDIEATYERQSEEYAGMIRVARYGADHLKETMANPERRAEYMREMDEHLREQGSPYGTFDEAQFQNLIASFERMGVPSLEAQRERRAALNAWRGVTAPILALDNLERGRREDLERRFHTGDLIG